MKRQAIFIAILGLQTLSVRYAESAGHEPVSAQHEHVAVEAKAFNDAKAKVQESQEYLKELEQHRRDQEEILQKIVDPERFREIHESEQKELEEITESIARERTNLATNIDALKQQATEFINASQLPENEKKGFVDLAVKDPEKFNPEEFTTYVNKKLNESFVPAAPKETSTAPTLGWGEWTSKQAQRLGARFLIWVHEHLSNPDQVIVYREKLANLNKALGNVIGEIKQYQKISSSYKEMALDKQSLEALQKAITNQQKMLEATQALGEEEVKKLFAEILNVMPAMAKGAAEWSRSEGQVAKLNEAWAQLTKSVTDYFESLDLHVSTDKITPREARDMLQEVVGTRQVAYEKQEIREEPIWGGQREKYDQLKKALLNASGEVIPGKEAELERLEVAYELVNKYSSTPFQEFPYAVIRPMTGAEIAARNLKSRTAAENLRQ